MRTQTLCRNRVAPGFVFTLLAACSSPADNTLPPPTDDAICAAAEVGPPLLRRLTNVELENTLGDIFPVIKPTWQGVKLGVDPVSEIGFGNDAAVLQVGQRARKKSSIPPKRSRVW